MTSATAVKPFVVEELAPGEYLREARQTWSTLTYRDKCKLSLILGIDQVLRIERLHAQFNF